MEIGIISFGLVCIGCAVAGGVITFFVIRNNPGILDSWMRKLQDEKEKVERELADLKKRLGS